MKIKYTLFFGLVLFLLSCSKDSDPVCPEPLKTTIKDKETEESTDVDKESTDVDKESTDEDKEQTDEDKEQTDVDKEQTDEDKEQTDEDKEQTDADEEQTDEDKEQTDADEEQTEDNTPPTAAVPTIPADAATDIALNTDFSWDAGTDVDGDELTYDVYLDENNPPKAKVASNIFNKTTTSLSKALKSGTKYYWYVTTKDGHNDAIKSEIKSFTTTNTPPTAAILTAPANEATGIALNTDLTWDAGTDPDGDALTYDVYLDENKLPTSKIASDISSKTTSLTNIINANTTYYWFVTSKDGKGGETKSKVQSFSTISNRPPTAAMLIAPADDAKAIFAAKTDLSWGSSTDSDGDVLTYDVYLDESNPPTTKIASDLTTLNEHISLTNAPDGSTTYYWFVTSKDGKGGETKSKVQSFTTAIRPENKAELIAEVNVAINREGNNPDLTYIDTSLITDMDELFMDYIDFNGDISTWDTSNVRTMRFMFYNAHSFNRDLSQWDVSKVIDMKAMFASAFEFEGGDLSGWDVSKVIDMSSMFTNAINFNGDISRWDVSKVVNMNSMFHRVGKFDGDLSKWNVGSVTSMVGMFLGAVKFNADLSKWDVSKVQSMNSMFSETHIFEGGDLSKWDVSKVANMRNMFFNSYKFDGDISKWDVGKVRFMNNMFYNARSFNRNIRKWDVSEVLNMNNIFFGASNFKQDINQWDVSMLEEMGTLMFTSSGLAGGNEPDWYKHKGSFIIVPLNR